MDKEYRGLFEKLGYNIDSRGAIFFEDLLNDTRQLLKEGYTDEEIKEELPTICSEVYEIGRKIYYAELHSFCNNHIIDRENRTLNKKIIGRKLNLDLEDLIIIFAKYFNKLEQRRQNQNKVLIKK